MEKFVYVQRDENSAVIGVFALPQPQPDGSTLTDPDPLPRDHPDVAAYFEAQA